MKSYLFLVKSYLFLVKLCEIAIVAENAQNKNLPKTVGPKNTYQTTICIRAVLVQYRQFVVVLAVSITNNDMLIASSKKIEHWNLSKMVAT